MLNKYFPVLLVRVRIRKPFFHLTIPIALFVFIGLLDCALDILEAVQFIFFRSNEEYGESFKGVLIFLYAVRSILSGIGTGEKFELVNVEADGVSIHIGVY